MYSLNIKHINHLGIVKYLFLAFIISLASLIQTSQTQAVSATNFNAANIISDSVFTNSNSMDAGQIQNFLNSKVSACDTYGTQKSEYGGGTRAQWAASKGYSAPFTCIRDYKENGKSAAQIIYDISRQYQINPQVIIVLLQKEQGLITDTWPLSVQYRTATGYGCPDTAPCDSQYYGLTNQITWSAKMFHSILTQNPNWYTPYTVGSNIIKWNPSDSCGTSNVTIQNLSTAALYSYTPYRPNQAALNAGYGTGDSCSSYGNRNFYLYFNDWFGSTIVAEPIGASLYTQQSTGNAFLVVNGIRYHIPSWDMMVNYGLDKYGTITVDDPTINNLANGGALTNLIWDQTGVYLVNNGVRHHANMEMCTAWGLDCLNGNQVKGLGSLYQSNGLSQGQPLNALATYQGVLYKMSGGKRQPIANSQTVTDLNLSSTPILGVSKVNSTQPLGPLLITTPAVITFKSSMYYFNGTTYYKIQNPDQYNDWNMRNQPQINNPQASSYDTTPPVSTALASWIKDGSTYYVIDQGRRISIPDNQVELWPLNNYVNLPSQPSQAFNLLPKESLQQTLQVGSKIYVLDGTTKRYIPTYDDYTGLQLNEKTTISILPDKATSIPEGSHKFADGKILTIQDGSGKAYVVNNGKLTHILGPEVFDGYKFDWGKIYSYDQSITSSYPIDTGALYHSRSGDNVFLNSKGVIYKLSIEEAVGRGVKTNEISSVTSSVIKDVSAKTMSRLLHDDSTGKVYFSSNGTLQHVVSYSTYKQFEKQYGLTHVDTKTIQAFNVMGTIN